MIKAVMVNKEGVHEVDFTPELDVIYDLLECSIIDITRRYIGGKLFDIVCDDEGLMKDFDLISASSRENPENIIVGNIIIILHDERGKPKSLSEKDISIIMNNIGYAMNVRTGETFKMITMD